MKKQYNTNIDFSDPRLISAIEDLDIMELLDECGVEYSLEGRNIGSSFIGVETCPNCFPKGSLILTEDGLKDIYDLKEYKGKVLSNDGEFNHIVKFWERNLKSEDLVEFYAFGMVKPIKTTKQHKIFCAEIISGQHIGDFVENKSNHKNSRMKQTWVIGEIEAGTLLKQKLTKQNIWFELPNITPKFNKIIFDAYFLGLYCADGCISGDKNKKNLRTITFCLNKTTKKHIPEKIIKFYKRGKIYDNKNSLSRVVELNDVSKIPNFLECGMGCNNKKIPNKILLNGNKHSIQNFINGLFDGDGHVCKNGLKTMTTTSMHLALQTSILLRRLGYSASINSYQQIKTGKDNITRKENVTVSYNPNIKYRHSNIRLINGKWYGKLKSVKLYRKQKCKVYNLTINNNHSYTANGAVVSNCGKTNFHFGIHKEKLFGSCLVCKVYYSPLKLVSVFKNINLKDAFDYLIEDVELDLDVEQRVKQILKPRKKEREYTYRSVDELPENKPITKKIIDRNPLLKAFLKERRIKVWDVPKYDLRIGINEHKDKIIFPVHIDGKVVSYQWRRITRKQYHIPDNLAHYLLWEDEITENKSLFVCEGYLDAVHLRGFFNTYYPNRFSVTTGFTKSLSKAQENILIEKNPKTVIFILDSKAWFDYKKYKDRLNTDVNFIILPNINGKESDPNSLTYKQLKKIFNEQKEEL